VGKVFAGYPLNAVGEADGVIDGVGVMVNREVAVGVAVSVKVAVGVNVGVNVLVIVNVAVGVGVVVNVGVNVSGWKGVNETVGVAVSV